MTDALDRARADLRSGREWKARDRLTGMLNTRHDDEVLDLLGEVHYEMRNLPAAGALWFVTGRDDARAREALAAWHERFGNVEARWSSLPPHVRHGSEEQRMKELHREARERARTRWLMHRHGDTGQQYARRERLTSGFLAACIAAGFVLTVIGFVTVLSWIWN